MKHWNGLPESVRSLDLARSKQEENCPGPRHCLVCGRDLPQGLARTYCVAHSAYPQELMRRERRRADSGSGSR